MNALFRGPCPEPELITAFVDGELGHDERDSVQTHLASCSACRADVDGERRAKRAVQSLVPVAPSPDLLARLAAVGAGAEPVARPSTSTRFRDPCPERELITALVDGELLDDERVTLQSHLTTCARCSADVVAERNAKHAVQSLGPVAPSPELVARITAVSGVTDLDGPAPADLLAHRAARSARAEDARRRRPRALSVLAGAASVAVFMLGATAFIGGATQGVTHDRPAVGAIVPAAERFSAEHAATTVSGGFGEPALNVVSASFVSPTTGTP